MEKNKIIIFGNQRSGTNYVGISISQLLQLPWLAEMFSPGVSTENYSSTNGELQFVKPHEGNFIPADYSYTQVLEQIQIRANMLAGARNGFVVKIQTNQIKNVTPGDWIKIWNPEYLKVAVLRKNLKQCIISYIIAEELGFHPRYKPESPGEIDRTEIIYMREHWYQLMPAYIKNHMYLYHMYNTYDWDIKFLYEDFVGDPHVDFGFISNRKINAPIKPMNEKNKIELIKNIDEFENLFYKTVEQLQVPEELIQ